MTDSMLQTIATTDRSVTITPALGIYNKLLEENLFLNSKGTPQSLAISKKKQPAQGYLFYVFAMLFLFLGILKTIFSRYFTTMFRVFFNTSLRQSQLTDQLGQATLPSLLFNFFFALSAGLFIYVLYDHYNTENNKINWSYLLICFIAVAVCYLVKYISLLLIGWLTGYRPEAKMYIFSVFLLNKIISLVLLPFSLLLAFCTDKIASFVSVISLMFLGLLFITRFFRAYGLLKSRLKFNGFHFIVYIVALEILPILLIYKSVMIFFGINS
ncbi:MAG: DUF4271 domain-containing protein [Ferruginibacter sp.]